MKLPFQRGEQAQPLRKPAPSDLPALEHASAAALYRTARMGGDFFDFLAVHGRLLFLLLDIAGKRHDALSIAAEVQDIFQNEGARIFKTIPLNEADAISDLTIVLNRAIMKAANGVRCAPGFLGCYDEDLSILFYINAGGVPALLKDEDGISLLAANGLPLGLFLHATHEAGTCVLRPGAVVLAVSKGLIESRSKRQEFGIERLREALQSARFRDANQLCSAVLTAVQRFTGKSAAQNDATALALMRAAAPVAAGIAASVSS